MSPISRVVRSIRLNQSERIDVVRQNGDQEVILSLVEDRVKIQQRTAIRLTIPQAHQLSRALSGIAVLVGNPPGGFLQPDDDADGDD